MSEMSDKYEMPTALLVGLRDAVAHLRREGAVDNNLDWILSEEGLVEALDEITYFLNALRFQGEGYNSAVDGAWDDHTNYIDAQRKMPQEQAESCRSGRTIERFGFDRGFSAGTAWMANLINEMKHLREDEQAPLRCGRQHEAERERATRAEITKSPFMVEDRPIRFLSKHYAGAPAETVRHEIDKSIIEHVREVARRTHARGTDPISVVTRGDADFLESLADMLQVDLNKRIEANRQERLSQPSGVLKVAQERQRQIEVEGWDPDHDDEHDGNELAWAAVCYAAPGPVLTSEGFDTAHEGRAGAGIYFGDPWPWDRKWDKRSKTAPNRLERIRELEKSGALICAEIDRLLRAEADDPTERAED